MILKEILQGLMQEKKTGYRRMDGPTNRWSDQPTDAPINQRTHPLIEMRGRIGVVKHDIQDV